MSATEPVNISTEERTILRDLAKEMAELADQPVQVERIELWKKHNSLQDCRPMILVFPEGAWRELLPQSTLKCQSDIARGMEWKLRSSLYYRDHLHDDTVIVKTWDAPRAIHSSGWGIAPKHIASTTDTGAWHFDPVIHEASDLKKIKHPELHEDEAESAARLALAQDLFGDILEIRQTGVTHISYHLMNQYTGLRGLEEVMMDMYTEPEMLHEAMSILEEGHHKVLKQWQDLNLLDLNNDNSYQNSGGNSWTDELPVDGFAPQRVRPCDMWASAEAQEMAQVSPEHHAEFVLPYEKRLLEPFGLTGYGCCEPMHDRFDEVLTIPGIRRLSISPWTDIATSAERLKGDYIFSWKPNPAHLVGEFNEDLVRNYIRTTVEACREHGCRLEMVLKDTHTCENHPERFESWLRIAREEIERN
ncbi:MAG: uroporphyrinogen decarboxylase/cobalamine-independent methonine synthase family protein [Planctomycetota bacterium]|jgi:hypothetical protein